MSRITQKKPVFSIITPCLNSARYLEKAIESVLSQNVPEIEHIVVDGGSSDATLEILNSYKHLRWISEKDKGQSDAMNKGFALARGTYIGYLNADDHYLPGAFQAALQSLSQSTLFVVGNVQVVDEEGKTIWINKPRVGFEEMLRHWEDEAFPVNSAGYFYHRSVQEAVGGFNVENRFAMDLEFLLKAAKQFPFTKIDSLLAVFLIAKDTVTGRSQLQDETWSPASFPFIDPLMEDWPKERVLAYQKDRARGYLARRIRQKESALRALASRPQNRLSRWLPISSLRKETSTLQSQIAGLQAQLKELS